MYSKCSVSTCSQQQQASRWLVSGRLWSRAQFPGGCCCCCLIKVGLFHRQSEVCEGASERPDERTDSSGEKLLLFFFSFLLQLRSGSPPPSSSTSLSLFLSLAVPARPAGTLSLIIHRTRSRLTVGGDFPLFLAAVFFLGSC